jgi:hypothetical protein
VSGGVKFPSRGGLKFPKKPGTDLALLGFGVSLPPGSKKEEGLLAEIPRKQSMMKTDFQTARFTPLSFRR